MVGERSSHRKQLMDATEDDVPGDPLELSSLGCGLLLFEVTLYDSLLDPMGVGVGIGGTDQISYVTLEETAVVGTGVVATDVSGDVMVIFSSRLESICDMTKGSSWSEELRPEAPLAPADVDGRLAVSDCARLANDVIASPL